MTPYANLGVVVEEYFSTDERFCNRAGRYFMTGKDGLLIRLAVTRPRRAETLVNGRAYI
jgi:hypothetical protein